MWSAAEALSVLPWRQAQTKKGHFCKWTNPTPAVCSFSAVRLAKLNFWYVAYQTKKTSVIKSFKQENGILMRGLSVIPKWTDACWVCVCVFERRHTLATWWRGRLLRGAGIILQMDQHIPIVKEAMEHNRLHLWCWLPSGETNWRHQHVCCKTLKMNRFLNGGNWLQRR